MVVPCRNATSRQSSLGQRRNAKSRNHQGWRRAIASPVHRAARILEARLVGDPIVDGYIDSPIALLNSDPRSPPVWLGAATPCCCSPVDLLDTTVRGYLYTSSGYLLLSRGVSAWHPRWDIPYSWFSTMISVHTGARRTGRRLVLRRRCGRKSRGAPCSDPDDSAPVRRAFTRLTCGSCAVMFEIPVATEEKLARGGKLSMASRVAVVN